MKLNFFTRNKPELNLPNPLGSTDKPSPLVQKTQQVAKQALSKPPVKDFSKQAEGLRKWMLANGQNPQKSEWLKRAEKKGEEAFVTHLSDDLDTETSGEEHEPSPFSPRPLDLNREFL